MVGRKTYQLNGVSVIMETETMLLYHGSKFNDVITTTIGVHLTKQIYLLVKKICAMGQDWGYCLGNYASGGGGYQNNRTWKRLHATDGDIVLGFKAEPKGHLGQSSGACDWSICSNRIEVSVMSDNIKTGSGKLMYFNLADYASHQAFLIEKTGMMI